MRMHGCEYHCNIDLRYFIARLCSTEVEQQCLPVLTGLRLDCIKCKVLNPKA